MCIVGHAQTFLIAKHRAEQAGGKLVLRIEDLDAMRCKSNYYDEMIEDLLWMGLSWQSGPDKEPSDELALRNIPFFSLSDTQANRELRLLNSSGYRQSSRMPIYLAAFRYLLSRGCIYPSSHSRKDVEAAVSAPHEGDAEVLFPVSLRPPYMRQCVDNNTHFPEEVRSVSDPLELKTNWRFCVPDGEAVDFEDGRYGPQRYVCNLDIGDFIVWRGSDNIPSYEFAVVVDDICMGITEIVRGFDLLQSTARQILLYRAFKAELTPTFYHCPLIRDANGVRLAKRSFSQSIRTLREKGYSVKRIAEEFFDTAVTEELFGNLI
jgi:glutamyl/glutaminyl-tRNA synthetase